MALLQMGRGRAGSTAGRRAVSRVLATALVAGLAMTAVVAPTGAGAAPSPAGGSLGVNPTTHLRPGITPLVTPTFHRAASGVPHLTYWGGPLITAMNSIDVNYGPGTYLSDPTSASLVTSFTSQYLGSGVLDWLSEYDSPTQSIGRGSSGGVVTITPSPTDNGSSITDAQIQAELQAQIGGGHLPVPNANTSYALFFRPGQSICNGGQCSLVAGGFCAYHGTMTYGATTFTYQVMPDLAGVFGCGGGTDAQNTTSVLSHELGETITDPDVAFATTYGPPLSWYDATNGEIGDICNGAQGTFVGADAVTYTSQLLWSNAAASCIETTSTSPQFTSGSSTTFTMGVPGSFAVTATGIPFPTVTESGTLPAGVTFAGGVLSGTPGAGTGGTYPISFTAANGIGPPVVQAFTLTVGFIVTTTSLPAGVRGVPYSQQLNALGGKLPYKWKKVGTLPKGMKLAATGVLSGTPSTKIAAGSYSITVEVVDATKHTHLVATATLPLVLS